MSPFKATDNVPLEHNLQQWIYQTDTDQNEVCLTTFNTDTEIPNLIKIH
jgi:hypothetical protein